MRFSKIGCAATIALLAITTTPLAAQTAPPQEGASAADDGDKIGVEEIVVTAQKRSERLQDVPIAVQALTAEAAAAFGATRSEDLQIAVPGLTFTQSLASAAPFLRGVGSSFSAAGGESPVAFYIDDVYRSSTAAGFFGLHNIRSIEVLKGPQGTLFGRNATGGVINIVSQDPSDTLTGVISAEYGTYDRFETNVYVSGPLTDNLSGSATAYGMRQSGFGTNVVTGEDAFFRRSQYYDARMKLDLGPTTIRLAGDFSRDRGQDGVVLIYFPGSVNSFTRRAEYAGDYNTTGELNGQNINKQYGGSLKVDHEFGWATVRSISALRYTDIDVFQDADRTPRFFQTQRVNTTTRTFTEEIQLLSNKSGGIQWIAGFFFLDDLARYNAPQSSRLTPTQNQISSTQQSTQSYAGFGQVTVPVVTATNLTLGFRYTSDHREARDLELFINTNRPNTQTSGMGEKTWSRPSWRVALDHRFAPDILGYVSYSRGFKSGVFNLAPFSAAPVNPETLDSYEIGLKSILFENRLRFNIAAYHYKYDDIQVQANTTVNGFTSNILVNAASATINGFDVDSELAVFKNFKLRAGFAFVDGKYDDFPGAAFLAPLPTGGNSTTFRNAAGVALFRTPKYSANAAGSYTIPSGIGNFLLTASYSYSSEFFFTASQQVRQAPLSIVNTAVSWTDPAKTWGISVWGRNLADERRYLNANEISSGNVFSPAAPRTFGVTVSRNF